MGKSQNVTFNGSVTAGAISTGPKSPAIGYHAPGGESPPTDAHSGEHSTLLLVVATDVERRAVMEQVRAVNGMPHTPDYVPHHTVYHLGRIRRTEIRLAQVGPGAITPDAAGAATGALIDAVRPDHLILVGICYGLKDDDQNQPQRLGDVLVATELRLLAHRKVHDTGTESRGGRVHPSPMLLDRFRTASHDWDGDAAVFFGPMLTESVLVDSAAYRQWLRESEPGAMGGEMEASGIYAAAVRGKVDWGLVKGICDWGHQKDDSHHQAAADNAASFVIHAVRTGGLDPVSAHPR